MRRYKLWQPFWLAFYSKAFYQDVRQHWQGVAFVYLFILSAVCAISGIYRSHSLVQNALKNWQPWTMHLPAYGIYPLLVILYFALGSIEAVVYALLAKIFLKTGLPYKDLFRLSIVAITPKFIISAILPLFELTFTYQWILYFALGLGYLFFAIEANRHQGAA